MEGKSTLSQETGHCGRGKMGKRERSSHRKSDNDKGEAGKGSPNEEKKMKKAPI